MEDDNVAFFMRHRTVPPISPFVGGQTTSRSAPKISSRPSSLAALALARDVLLPSRSKIGRSTWGAEEEDEQVGGSDDDYLVTESQRDRHSLSNMLQTTRKEAAGGAAEADMKGKGRAAAKGGADVPRGSNEGGFSGPADGSSSSRKRSLSRMNSKSPKRRRRSINLSSSPSYGLPPQRRSFTGSSRRSTSQKLGAIAADASTEEGADSTTTAGSRDAINSPRPLPKKTWTMGARPREKPKHMSQPLAAGDKTLPEQRSEAWAPPLAPETTIADDEETGDEVDLLDDSGDDQRQIGAMIPESQGFGGFDAETQGARMPPPLIFNDFASREVPPAAAEGSGRPEILVPESDPLPDPSIEEGRQDFIPDSEDEDGYGFNMFDLPVQENESGPRGSRGSNHGEPSPPDQAGSNPARSTSVLLASDNSEPLRPQDSEISLSGHSAFSCAIRAKRQAAPYPMSSPGRSDDNTGHYMPGFLAAKPVQQLAEGDGSQSRFFNAPPLTMARIRAAAEANRGPATVLRVPPTPLQVRQQPPQPAQPARAAAPQDDSDDDVPILGARRSAPAQNPGASIEAKVVSLPHAAAKGKGKAKEQALAEELFPAKDDENAELRPPAHGSRNGGAGSSGAVMIDLSLDEEDDMDDVANAEKEGRVSTTVAGKQFIWPTAEQHMAWYGMVVRQSSPMRSFRPSVDLFNAEQRARFEGMRSKPTSRKKAGAVELPPSDDEDDRGQGGSRTGPTAFDVIGRAKQRSTKPPKKTWNNRGAWFRGRRGGFRGRGRGRGKGK